MILAIGLEAAEVGLIEKYVELGHLPTFARLLKDKALVRALSPSSISSGSTWVSLITGTNPAKHGMGFSHRQLRTGSYDIVKKYAEETKAPFFWDLEEFKDKKVAILDVPATCLKPGINGKMIVGWGSESLNAPRSSWPKSLLHEMIDKHGDHPLNLWYQKIPTTVAEWTELESKILLGLERRSNMYEDILMSDDWDLFFASVAETHWAGHFFMHMIEPKHLSYNEALAKQFESTILKVYQRCDALIERLSSLKPEAQLLVFSNTGMGPNFSGRHHITPLLQAMGLFPPASESVLPVKRFSNSSIKKIEDFIGPENIEVIKKFIPERFWDRATRKMLNIGSRWRESKAFELPSDYTGCIRINLEGREPHGKVKMEEYRNICHSIKQTFLALTDEGGQKIVDEVLLIRDVYTGDHVDDLPDIAIVWSGQQSIGKIISPQYGSFSGALEDKRTGAHLPYGFIGYYGGTPMPSNDKKILVEDIAPTILKLLSIDIPGHMEGRPLIQKAIF